MWEVEAGHGGGRDKIRLKESTFDRDRGDQFLYFHCAQTRKYAVYLVMNCESTGPHLANS